MNRKLIVIDMDGTMLYGASKISPFTVETLRELSRQGHLIVLSSGRPYRSMKMYYQLLECTGPIICYNGALVFDPKNRDFPSISRMFSKEMLSDIAIKAPYITSFMAEDLDHIYISRVDHHLKKYFWYEGMEVHEGDMSEIIEHDTYTALFRCIHAHDSELSILASSYPGIELRHWTDSFYSELAFKGQDKGAGVAHIAQYFGIERKDVYAFGDADNDVGMLQQAGHPFAMKGCKSRTLASLFPSTKKGNAQDGVALTLLEELS